MKFILIIMIAQQNISMATAEFDSQVACEAAFVGIIQDFTANVPRL